MTIPQIIFFHILAGALGVFFGMAALCFHKGGRLHRNVGNIFFISMLMMAASAFYVAIMKQIPDSVISGALVFYLVTTSWVTVKRKASNTGYFEYCACAMALLISVYAIHTGLAAADGVKMKFPANFYFFQAGIAGFVAMLDMSVIYRGGIAGAQRITRHLWRMTFSLWVSATSIFLGNQHVFPDFIQQAKLFAVPVLAVPVMVILALLLYWLIRVNFTGWRTKVWKPSSV